MTIVQAVLNEDVSPEDNPAVPLTAEAVATDAVEALEAGASVVHFHARRPGGGQVADDLEYYQAVARSELKNHDVLWYPPQPSGRTGAERWKHVGPLVADDGLQMITIDPASFDWMDYDAANRKVRVPRLVEQIEESDAAAGPSESSLEQWIWFCEESQRLGITPMFGIFEPGALRRVLAWHELGLVNGPVVVNFFLTDRFSFGLPAAPSSLDFYLSMVPDDVELEWFCCPIGVTAEVERELQLHAIRTGGHLRIGIGTPPLEGHPEGSTNQRLVRDAVDLVVGAGGSPATTADAREILGIGRREPRTTE